MKPERQKFFLEADSAWEPTTPGCSRQIMGYDNQIMLVKVRFETGAAGPAHSHFHTQSSFVASGRFEVTVGQEKQILGPGNGFYAEPNVVHGVLCLEQGVIVDTFAPVREDFLK